MNLIEQYERIKEIESTPDIVEIKEKLESFIHKSQYLKMMANLIDSQVEELIRLSDELDKEEKTIERIILSRIKK